MVFSEMLDYYIFTPQPVCCTYLRIVVKEMEDHLFWATTSLTVKGGDLSSYKGKQK